MSGKAASEADNTRMIETLQAEIELLRRRNDTLQKSCALLNEIKRFARVGVWDWDIASGRVSWSDEVFTIFGLDRDTFTPQINSILDLSPWPEDRRRGEELIEKAIASKQKGEYDQRFLRPDGSVGYYHSTFQGEYNDDGELTEIYGVVQETTPLRIAEGELKKEFERLGSIIDAFHLGTWEWVVRADSVAINENLAELLGLTKHQAEALTRREWSLMIHPDDAEAVAENDRAIIAGEKKACDAVYRLHSSDDEWKWVQARTRLIPNDVHGEPPTLMSVFSDVTDLKTKEAELSLLERQYHSYFMNAPYGVFIVDREGAYLDVNPVATGITGYSSDELRAMKIPDLLPRGGRKAGLEHFQQLVETGRSDGVVTFLTKSGEERQMFISAVKINDNRFMSFTEDVTEQELTRKKLRESEEQYRMLARNSVDVIWRMDLGLRFTFVSPSVEPTFGYTQEEFVGMRLPQVVTKRELFNTARRAYHALRNFKTYDHVIFETALLRKDGVQVPVEISSTLVYNDKGLPVGFQGATRDISERKRAESALRASEFLNRRFIESSVDCVLFLDSDGSVQFANQLAMKLLIGDRAGVRWSDLWGDDRREAATRSLEHASKDGSASFDGVLGEGSNCTNWDVMISIIQDDQPDNNQFLVVARDVTEREQVKHELLRRLQELEIFNDAATGRELRINEHRREINELMKRLGEKPKYVVVE